MATLARHVRPPKEGEETAGKKKAQTMIPRTLHKACDRLHPLALRNARNDPSSLSHQRINGFGWDPQDGRAVAGVLAVPTMGFTTG